MFKNTVLKYFQHNAGSYKLDKPIVVGEFASESSQGESVEQLYEYVYSNGFIVSNFKQKI
jgi:hypothetical protein